MTEPQPTLAGDIAALRQLADRLDPDMPWPQGAPDDPDQAGTLRRVADHLERVMSGGDRDEPGLAAKTIAAAAEELGVPSDQAAQLAVQYLTMPYQSPPEPPSTADD